MVNPIQRHPSKRGRAIWKLAVAIGWLLAIATARAQTLDLAVEASPTGLDPHLTTNFSSFVIYNGTIYEGLTAIDQNLQVVPSLATSWTISPDGKTYTFHLASGVTFHDGTAMAAEDVVATINRVKSKEIASPLASRLNAVISASAVSPRTVELRLSQVSAPLLGSLAGIAIVPRSAETSKDALQRKPVGTGPFKFKEWKPNDYIVLVRNEHYWTDKAKLDEVRFHIVSESITRRVGLITGQFAMLPNADPITALQLKGKPGIKVSEAEELAYTLIGMNAGKSPFNHPKARQALNYALNRDEIIKAALFGAAVPAGPVSPALGDWAMSVSEFPCYRTNQEKARALLREAGFSNPVEVTMKVYPRQDLKDIAQVVQEELNHAGFRVEILVQETGQFDQDWRKGNFDIFVSANAGATDPDDYFYRTFHTGASTNVFGYSDSKVDELLEFARFSQDKAARKLAYNQVQSILACSGPVAHLAYATLSTPMREDVLGFITMPNRSLVALKHTSLATGNTR